MANLCHQFALEYIATNVYSVIWMWLYFLSISNQLYFLIDGMAYEESNPNHQVFSTFKSTAGITLSNVHTHTSFIAPTKCGFYGLCISLTSLSSLAFDHHHFVIRASECVYMSVLRDGKIELTHSWNICIERRCGREAPSPNLIRDFSWKIDKCIVYPSCRISLRAKRNGNETSCLLCTCDYLLSMYRIFHSTNIRLLSFALFLPPEIVEPWASQLRTFTATVTPYAKVARVDATYATLVCHIFCMHGKDARPGLYKIWEMCFTTIVS